MIPMKQFSYPGITVSLTVFLCFVFASLGPAQAMECPTVTPHIPDGLYGGPYGRFPTFQEVLGRIKENGEYHPATERWHDYYRIKLGDTYYIVYPDGCALEINRMVGYDPARPQDFFNLSVLDLQVIPPHGQDYWLTLRVDSERRFCTLEVSGITGSPWLRMEVPRGSTYFFWACYENQGNQEDPDYQQISEWNEVIFPDGQVYVPNPSYKPGESEEVSQASSSGFFESEGSLEAEDTEKDKDSDSSVQPKSSRRWVPVDPRKSWLHHPELIPEEARFQKDPLIRLLLEGSL